MGENKTGAKFSLYTVLQTVCKSAYVNEAYKKECFSGLCVNKLV